MRTRRLRLTETRGDWRAALRAMLSGTRSTMDSSRLLGIFERLHGDLRRLLTESGLYDTGQVNRLLIEVEQAVAEQARAMTALSQAARREAWLSGVAQIDELVAAVEINYVAGPSGLENSLVQQFLTTDLIAGVTDDMVTAINAQVVSGAMLGATPYEVMRQITQIIGIRDARGFRELGTTGVSAKAERILRTELMTMLNAGSNYRLEQARGWWPDLTDVWMATGDMRTRDTHLAAHGQKRGADGYFWVGGARAKFPGDPSLPPGERVNCRCRTVPYRAEWGEVGDLIGPVDRSVGEERRNRTQMNADKRGRAQTRAKS